MFLDLSIRHFTRRAGSLLVIGTWYRDEQHQWKPTLALIRADEEMNGLAKPCIIGAGTSWMWSEQIGDPAAAARSAMAFAKILRIGDTASAAIFIARTINEHLADLLTIPPLPPADRREARVAEGTITNRDTGRRAEFAINA